MKKIAVISFTEAGHALALRIASALDDAQVSVTRGYPVREWAEQNFSRQDALIFVGALGIAVRAIAPLLKSKTTDPAVIVLDETGKFCIPVVSGHLGGANALADAISKKLGSLPVITTATDRRGVFAIDCWAKDKGITIENPAQIKLISSKLLAGEDAKFYTDFPVSAPPPHGIKISDALQNADITLSVRQLAQTSPDALRLIPRIVYLGIGCKKGTCEAQIAFAVEKALLQMGIHPLAVGAICTIDRKGEETGLIAFCKTRKLPLKTFTTEELSACTGIFSASEFVKGTVGVDNVCERAAVCGSGSADVSGLILRKTIFPSVTVAAAQAVYTVEFSGFTE